MRYLDYISKYSGKDIAELKTMSQRDLVDNVILPLWVKPSGQRTRGWRVPDTFMAFMARFGNYCYLKDAGTGAVLYEIAMQRISCGAVMHKHRKIGVTEFLPHRYSIYAVGCDQPGIMSPACWAFLRDQMKHMLVKEETQEHARAILFGILDNVDYRGNLLNGYILGSGNGIPDPRDLWAFAVKNVMDKSFYPWAVQYSGEDKGLVPVDVAEKHFSRPNNWRNYLWYWSQRWSYMNKDAQQKFFSSIGVSGWWQKRIVKKEIARYAAEMKF